MNTAPVMDRTRAFILENFLYMRSDVTFADSDSLLRHGIIDSLGVVELVEFLQQTFDVAIGDDEITEENLGSLSAIGRYVTRKLDVEPVRASA